MTAPRCQQGLTLPFALILTFIFSSLVAVSYMFVSINISSMQSSLHSAQAVLIAEGINERIKARLNTKSKIKQSPQQEERLKAGQDEEFEEDEEDIALEEEFDEDTESYDEYYADEVTKIARYITFREPPEEEPGEVTTTDEAQGPAPEVRPEANVKSIGSIEVPRGIVLTKGTMLVVFKDEKLNLNLKDIAPETPKYFRDKLPVPIVKTLLPNFCEANSRSSFSIVGENLSNINEASFSNSDIIIEDIKAGPTVEFLVNMDVMPGLTRFYFGSQRAEFYVIPPYDGSSRPVIDKIKMQDGNDLLEAKAAQRNVILMIYGYDLFLKKAEPVVIPDIVGIVPKIRDASPNGKEITITLDIDKKVEPGTHTLSIATEGGISNSWLFNVLPPEKKEADLGANVATFTSSLTLLEIKAVESLLPLIDEEETEEETKEKTEDESKDFEEDMEETSEEDEGEGEEELEEELSEKEKLSPLANADLETSWLLETSCMVGKVTKTISEVIQRKTPKIQAGLTTNGKVNFSGGSFMISGLVASSTTLFEPTYVSNTQLIIQGPQEETEEATQTIDTGQERPQEAPKTSPVELGFIEGSLVAVYETGKEIEDLDFGKVKTIGPNTIELALPGLRDFHSEGEQITQFIPALISKEKPTKEEGDNHLMPKEFRINLSNAAIFKNIFGANLDGLGELADFFTNEGSVPLDESGIPLGYMGLSYVEGTPIYDETNVLSGKGILAIDTRSDNAGNPTGTVEIRGDSRNPADFTGIVYVHGNLRIDGNVNVNGAVIVDNDSNGQIEIASNAIGGITYNERIIKQSLLYTPFTTKAGTIRISNKPLDLEDAVQTGVETPQLGRSSTIEQEQVTFSQEEERVTPAETELVEAEVQREKPRGGSSAEKELIDLL